MAPIIPRYDPAQIVPTNALVDTLSALEPGIIGSVHKTRACYRWERFPIVQNLIHYLRSLYLSSNPLIV